MQKTSTIFLATVIPHKIKELDSIPLYFIAQDDDKNFLNNESQIQKILSNNVSDKFLAYNPNNWVELLNILKNQNYSHFIIKKFLPGVTDTKANTINEVFNLFSLPLHVTCGSGFAFNAKNIKNKNNYSEYFKYKLYNELTEIISVIDLNDTSTFNSRFWTENTINKDHKPKINSVNLDLSDAELIELSNSKLLALTLAEMKNIQKYYQSTNTKNLRLKLNLSPKPNDIELEIIAQTWSEHCKHKIFNATITCHYFDSENKLIESKKINSLFKEFIESPTLELMPEKPNLLSVFSDNAGIIKFDENYSVCFKVETHNSPSALEPFGGAVTGLLGVNRDILGTGLGAKPILNTDVLCFSDPFEKKPLHEKLLPSYAIINGVRKGIEDAGNKSGIPCVNGSIFYHTGYRAKPLVFCGTAGVMPLTIDNKETHKKYTKINDRIVMVGGRVGADGIHGATFSSIALNENSPRSAVQIGDPLTQKRMLDFIIKARDLSLITGITDNGAGGLSSSVGEMARLTNGASLYADKVPLKYPGLDYWEIIVSESQERMTVSTDKFDELSDLASEYGVEITDIGYFHDRGYLEILSNDKTIAVLDLDFLHNGHSDLNLKADFKINEKSAFISEIEYLDVKQDNNYKASLNEILLSLLSHPNIASKEPVIRQYDHEVGGKTIIKPFTGPKQDGPNDAACVLPYLNSSSGIIISCGINPLMSFYDCYLMAILAVDEAIRNALCVGCNMDEIYLLDNFCFPDPIESDINKLGHNNLKCLVSIAQGLKEAVLAFKAPLISGKDSMKNDFITDKVKLSDIPTLLISAIGKIDDINNCTTASFKNSDDYIYLLTAGNPGLAGSHLQSIYNLKTNHLPNLNLSQANLLYHKINQAMNENLINSAHDLSEGGLAIAISESCIGGDLGARINISKLFQDDILNSPETIKNLPFNDNNNAFKLFAEAPGSILVSVSEKNKNTFESLFKDHKTYYLGRVIAERKFIVEDVDKNLINASLEEIVKAYKTPQPID